MQLQHNETARANRISIASTAGASGSGGAVVAIDPSTGASAPDQWELDLDLTYTFPSGRLKGLQIKTRAALINIEGTSGILPDIRLILNWPLPLL